MLNVYCAHHIPAHPFDIQAGQAVELLVDYQTPDCYLPRESRGWVIWSDKYRAVVLFDGAVFPVRHKHLVRVKARKFAGIK